MTIRFAVLDDHRSFAEAMSVSLSSFSDLESVGIATTIPEFIELCVAYTPDVVLVDYQLGDGTAFDCAAGLAVAGVEARLVLITSHSVLPLWALDEGFEQVLSKEVSLEVVANALRVRASPEVIAVHRIDRIEFSRRQRHVLDLMGQGFDPAAIAEELSISVHTARSHVKAVMKLLSAPTQLAAVTTAIREGYLFPPK